jgi:hypothetical protein
VKEHDHEGDFGAAAAREGRDLVRGQEAGPDGGTQDRATGRSSGTGRTKAFPQMSVIANIKMGAFFRNDKAGIKSDIDKVFERFADFFAIDYAGIKAEGEGFEPDTGTRRYCNFTTVLVYAAETIVAVAQLDRALVTTVLLQFWCILSNKHRRP